MEHLGNRNIMVIQVKYGFLDNILHLWGDDGFEKNIFTNSFFYGIIALIIYRFSVIKYQGCRWNEYL